MEEESVTAESGISWDTRNERKEDVMKKGLIATGLVVLVLCLMMGAVPLEAKNYRWRIGTILPPASPVGQALGEFAKKVEARTNGQMKIQVGYSSSFGGLKDLVPAVSMGSVEMMVTAHNWWDTIDKNRKIFVFPYVFKDWEHMRAYIKSPLWEADLKALNKQNIHIIFPDPGKTVMWKRGPFRCILAKRPIFTAKDLEGLKLRLYESETAKRIWRHMGCNITVIAWAEAYLALKQGMVEAITTPMNLTYDMKFHEVAPYITNINEFLQMECIGGNKPKWDKLPSNIKKVMVEVLNEVATKSNEQLEQRVETDLQKMLDQGAFFIRTSLKSFEDKSAPLAKDLEAEGQWRKGLYDDIQKLKP